MLSLEAIMSFILVPRNAAFKYLILIPNAVIEFNNYFKYVRI